MRNFHFIEAASAVGGLEELHVRHVDRVYILRIGDHVHVIPGALQQRMAAVYEIPGVAAIVGAIKSAAFLGLDDGIDALGIRRYCQADATVGPFGRPCSSSFFQVVPASVER